MLSKIDNSIINASQWVVRQLELFTTITRKNLCTFFIRLFFAFTSLWGASLIMDGFFFGIFFLVAFFGPMIILYSIGGRFFYDKLLNAQNENHTSLPKEIITRKNVRLKNLIISSLFVVIISVTPHTPDITLLDSVIHISFIFSVVTETVIEYLLCTTSLPPGEKKKFYVEKETSDMIPTGI